jgi:3-hydroxybutyryl-CoA dehydrogenase
MNVIGIAGSGAMGSGIAQVAATAGYEVRIYDNNQEALTRSISGLNENINKLVEKQKITPAEGVEIRGRIYHTDNLSSFGDCTLVIEAIIENADIKKQLFKDLEKLVESHVILATNTSSLSISSLAAVLDHPERAIGIHFFNPAPLMKLVEIIPAVQTDQNTLQKTQKMIESFGKISVIAKDSPGFIVNKVARPFYSEALKIYEEGIASPLEIDSVMKSGGFKMGPFELMDFIGHDVNYAVTKSVWEAFYFEPRYRPSHIQLRLVEAGFLGRKSRRGFYDYTKDPINTAIEVDEKRSNVIFVRILSMLINEAADTVYHKICSEEDIETAVRYGVNYPKGLLEWGDETGWKDVARVLDDLFYYYHDGRYKVSPYIRQKCEK